MGAAFHNLQGDSSLFFSFFSLLALQVPLFFIYHFSLRDFFFFNFFKGTFLLCWLIFLCFNILCGFFSCIFPSLFMILILFVWILLFILLLIILFFDWLLWSLRFNFRSVQFDCFFIYLLIIFSIDFCCLLNTSRFWASCLSLFLSLLSFCNYT